MRIIQNIRTIRIIRIIQNNEARDELARTVSAAEPWRRGAHWRRAPPSRNGSNDSNVLNGTNDSYDLYTSIECIEININEYGHLFFVPLTLIK